MGEPEVPSSLRAEVARTLRPVRPLPRPRRRALLLLPALAVAAVLPPLLYGLRWDARRVGLASLLLGSALQIALAAALLALALRESVPGRLPSSRRIVAGAAFAAVCVLALTLFTFAASPTLVVLAREMRYFRLCFTRSFLVGVLPLPLVLLQLRRGLVFRPVVAGALAGVAAGLAGDAGVRLYCEVSAPSHVLPAHAGAIVALAAAGALIGGLALRGRPATPAGPSSIPSPR